MMGTPSGLPTTAPVPRETAFDALVQWAMHASRVRLAAWAIGGTVDAVAIVLVLPSWWLLAMPLLCIASIGAWGLAAQEIRRLDAAQVPAPLRRLGLKVVKTATVTIGTLAAIVGFYGVLLIVLGERWGPEGG